MRTPCAACPWAAAVAAEHCALGASACAQHSVLRGKLVQRRCPAHSTDPIDRVVCICSEVPKLTRHKHCGDCAHLGLSCRLLRRSICWQLWHSSPLQGVHQLRCQPQLPLQLRDACLISSLATVLRGLCGCCCLQLLLLTRLHAAHARAARPALAASDKDARCRQPEATGDERTAAPRQDAVSAERSQLACPHQQTGRLQSRHPYHVIWMWRVCIFPASGTQQQLLVCIICWLKCMLASESCSCTTLTPSF